MSFNDTFRIKPKVYIVIFVVCSQLYRCKDLKNVDKPLNMAFNSNAAPLKSFRL